METKEKNEYETLIMAWLRTKDGDIVRISDLGKKFKIGDASILAMLNELAACGKVRKTNAKRSIGFYIPSEAMLNAERKAAEEAPQRPALKIDSHRAELYARLDADRKAIRSIG